MNANAREANAQNGARGSVASANVGTKLQFGPPERPTRMTKPRLNRDHYIGKHTGKHTYHITLTTTDRAPLFDDLDLGRQFEPALRDCAMKLGFSLLACCFMPDHLHVFLRGSQPGSDLLKFVQRFKQVTGFRFKSISGDRPWQQSFFDRILREDEDPSAVAQCIFDNPAEAGLPVSSPAYSLRGGDSFRSSASDGAEASSLHLDSQARHPRRSGRNGEKS